MIGLILFTLAVVALLRWLKLRRHKTGLTDGEIIYETADGVRLDDALVSHRHRLVGRPDYVAEGGPGSHDERGPRPPARQTEITT